MKWTYSQPKWNDILASLIKGVLSWDLNASKFKYIDENGFSHEIPSTDSNGSLIAPSEGIKLTDNVIQYTKLTTLTATEIVGTAAGDIGHVDGAILVAAPSSNYILEFVSALLIYDYNVAAYTGGGNDVVIQVGAVGSQVSVSSAITGTKLLLATGDKILQLGAIATELTPLVGGAISIKGTAFTQPGTAAGVLRAYITYNKITTGL